MMPQEYLAAVGSISMGVQTCKLSANKPSAWEQGAVHHVLQTSQETLPKKTLDNMQSYYASTNDIGNMLRVNENCNTIQDIKYSGNPCQVDSAAKQARWVQPSGPREQGEGVENVEQGILEIERTENGQIALKVTLLVAGFIIGPGGATVRDICRAAGADIKSWTDRQGHRNRPVRVFVISGPSDSIRHALVIIEEAVERYKFLCEGQCSGTFVGRTQKIHGLEFSYQPPPRHLVPFAAAIKISSPPPSIPGATSLVPPVLRPCLPSSSAAMTSLPRLAHRQVDHELASGNLNPATARFQSSGTFPRCHPVAAEASALLQGMIVSGTSSTHQFDTSITKSCHLGTADQISNLTSSNAMNQSAITPPTSHSVSVGFSTSRKAEMYTACPADSYLTRAALCDSNISQLAQLMRPPRWDRQHPFHAHPQACQAQTTILSSARESYPDQPLYNGIWVAQHKILSPVCQPMCNQDSCTVKVANSAHCLT